MGLKHFIGGIFVSVMVLSSMVSCQSSPTSPAQVVAYQAATLAIVNGTLIDGTGAQPVPDAVILIAGDKILAVGSRRTLAVPAGARKLDVGGASILPGFINA